MRGKYRLTGVSLRNICQHDDVSWDIHTGLTAVTGPNGSGKTSLFRGLVYALTGLVDGSWGTQADLQKDGTALVGKASASFTDGEHQYEITRFSTSSVKFPDAVTCDGQAVATRRKQVDAYMADVFGMPCQLMFQLCWGRQGQLAQLLTAPPAYISAFLSQIFDTRICDKLRDSIKTAMDTIAYIPPSCVEQLVETRRDLEALEPEEAIEARLLSLKHQLEVTESDMERLQLPDDIDGVLRSRDELRRKLEQVNSRIAAMGQIDDPEGFDDVDTNEIWARIADIKATKIELQSSITASDAGVRSAKKTIDAAATKIADQKRAYELAEARVNAEPDRCALCGQPVQDVDAYRVRNIKMATGCDDWDTYDCQYNDTIRRLEDEAAAARDEIDKLERTKKEAYANLMMLDASLKLLNNVIRFRQLAELVHERDKCAEAMAELPDLDMDTIVKRRDDIARLQAEERRLEADIARATAALTDAKATRMALERTIATLETTVHAREINEAARNTLTHIREALSAQRAQARYMKHRIELLNVVLASYLKRTGMPFSLRLDPEQRRFIETTPEGYDHPAAHLSGAQQAMAAIALQMALFDVMSPSMNLYLIDEPTESLDMANKSTMADMFGAMNAMLPSVDGTMLIITRDEPVIERCSVSLEVGGEQ